MTNFRRYAGLRLRPITDMTYLKKVREELQEISDEANLYASAYFWTPASTPVLRKDTNFKHKKEVDITKGLVVSFSSSLTSSSKYCFYEKTILINGEKTTLRRLHTLIEAIDERIQALSSELSAS